MTVFLQALILVFGMFFQRLSNKLLDLEYVLSLLWLQERYRCEMSEEGAFSDDVLVFVHDQYSFINSNLLKSFTILLGSQRIEDESVFEIPLVVCREVIPLSG